MLRPIGAAITAIGVVVATLLFSPVSAASAADGVWCDDATGQCFISLSSPPSDPAPNPDGNGWTSGAPACYSRIDPAFVSDYPPEDVVTYSAGATRYFYVTIGCGNSLRYWSNSRQCFVSMAPGVWPPRPGGYGPDAGYYVCSPYIDQPGTITSYFWSNTVPPGLQVLTPGAAAQRLVSTFALRGIDIGMAPEVNPDWGHRRSYVGVPVWLWVENPQPLTWGPYTETATLGGQTITATAQVTSVRWDMGDGGSRVCGGTGTPYTTGYGVTDSPTCGYRYGATSEASGGDRYTVTATSQWTVTWTALSGANGTINLTTSSSDALEVNELQTVNVR